jgi:hypothetical protein
MSQLRDSSKFQQAKFTFKSVNKSTLYSESDEEQLEFEEQAKEVEKVELIEKIVLKKDDKFFSLDFCVNFEYLLEEKEKVQLPIIVWYPGAAY